jgi:hypothetical protein
MLYGIVSNQSMRRHRCANKIGSSIKLLHTMAGTSSKLQAQELIPTVFASIIKDIPEIMISATLILCHIIHAHSTVHAIPSTA